MEYKEGHLSENDVAWVVDTTYAEYCDGFDVEAFERALKHLKSCKDCASKVDWAFERRREQMRVLRDEQDADEQEQAETFSESDPDEEY